jgi:alkaline phosphatase D
MLRLAVASCQHWEFGSYAAHRHIVAESPDLVAFLGDYIYEWGPYQLRHPDRPTRTNESFTLADYRARYAQYKSDPDLQAAHLAAPWIVAWDDHEVANDYAGLVDERLSSTFAERRAAAYQAFYEHMPVRLPDPRRFDNVRMYQRYDWGRLARLHVLDDRQYRSPEVCPKPGRGGSNVVNARACPGLRDPARTMLGGEQDAWLAQGLSTSRARWNILAQQTLMAQMTYAPIVTPEDGRFWTDGWDGYPAAGGGGGAGRWAGRQRRRQSAGAGRGRAHVLRDRAAAGFQPAGVRAKPRGGDGVLRDVGDIELAAAGAHAGVPGTQSAHQVRAQRQARVHDAGGDAGSGKCALHGTG